jgi:beta-N-acetylhexosaminidase
VHPDGLRRPHSGAAALGRLGGLAVTEEVHAAIGARLAGAGVTLDLAPVADVDI